ncbi:hypothetical protein [Luteimonas sp. e5]
MTDRLEVRAMTYGDGKAWAEVFVKPELVGGASIPMLVTGGGDTEAEAVAEIDRKLSTPFCDAYASQLGDTMDARALGAWMEHCTKYPAATITDKQVTAAAKPISTAARRLRSALALHDETAEGRILDVAWPLGKRADLGAFRNVLETLCTLPERLETAGWETHSKGGPMPKGGADDWLVNALMEGWEKAIGRVSAAPRSRFMRAAPSLLALSSVTLGKDPESKIKRMLARNRRHDDRPLPPITMGGAN